jgi:hypothetical protein
MRYMSFFIIGVLTLEKLRKENIITINNKQLLNKSIKKFYKENKQKIILLK